MKQQEQARIKVLNSVLEYQLPIAQAAEIMGISERHTERLLAAYRKEGVAALAHGNRGRRPHNAVPEDAAAAVVKLASNHYSGANHSHLTELLREREGIDLSRPTVRRILVKAGIGSPRSRRSQQHRFRRKRMPQEGMLIQVDGSPHPWLEERGPKFDLLLAVDDATGTVTQAVFRTTEDTRGYLVLLEGLVRQWGIPLALYSDRHAAFKYNARQGPVLYESTQFARVMRELGIQQIFAMSPQAKGRVERMASTFQDRLVTELRLAGATTMEEANAVLQEFLPRFNKRFAVAAEQPETASGLASSHLDEDQRKLLAALDSSVEKRAKARKATRKATAKGRPVKEKPVRHQLHRKPTPTQQARWEAVQQAKSRGLSLRAIARELGMSRVATRKYAVAESPPTKLLSAKERAKAEALAQVQMAAD